MKDNDVIWFLVWSSNYDWSSWMESQFRKVVNDMPNTEDWMRDVWGPLIAAAMPELIKQIPLIIAAIIEAFRAMTVDQRVNLLDAASKLVGKKDA